MQWWPCAFRHVFILSFIHSWISCQRDRQQAVLTRLNRFRFTSQTKELVLTYCCIVFFNIYVQPYKDWYRINLPVSEMSYFMVKCLCPIFFQNKHFHRRLILRQSGFFNRFSIITCTLTDPPRRPSTFVANVFLQFFFTFCCVCTEILLC